MPIDRIRHSVRLLAGILLAAVLLSSCASAPGRAAHGTAGGTLRVMSFNVRYAAPGDGANVWENRRTLMTGMLLDEHPDIIGTQELLLHQARYLQDHLPGYAWFGRGRNGDEVDAGGNEHMGVFYATARLKLLEQGDFWYSETPDVPGSANFDGPMPRMATWGHFEDLRNGRRFYVFNTHFPHMAEHEALRQRCAQLLLERIERLAGGAPVVVTGDFNSGPGSASHRTLTAGLADAWQQAPQRHGPELTFHGFTGRPDARIDWILFRHFGISQVQTVDDHRGGIYPSDHYPVVATLLWQ